jgi:hypothetical protein
VADLFIREIQPHEIEAEDPDPQRLVMAGEDRPGHVIEVFLTGLAVRALSLGLGRIVTLFGDLRRVAMGTSYAFGPAQLADGFETLQVVDEVLDVDHRPCPRNPGEVCMHAAWGSPDRHAFYPARRRPDITARNPG